MDQIVRSLALLVFYAALFVIIHLTKRARAPAERRIYGLLYLAWAAPVFVANYLLSLVDLESFIPWHVNFMHTFVWIGLCLGWLYLGVRREPFWVQFVAFATFSLVVKVTEQRLFGVWSLEHFFFVFPGNWSYLLGWSLADGLYPLLSTGGLALLARWAPKLEDGGWRMEYSSPDASETFSSSKEQRSKIEDGSLGASENRSSIFYHPSSKK